MPRSESTAPHYIYILRCADNSFYTGQTTSIQTRLADHNAGKASNHTSRRRPVTLVLLEGPLSAKAAHNRERQLKTWSAEKKGDLITRTRRRCELLRAKIAAAGEGADAIGGPPDPSSLHTAQELSALLAFIREDQKADQFG